MNKLTIYFMVGFTTLFFTACGGGGSSDTNTTITASCPTTVNIIGTWEYEVTTQNSTCDGLIAEGFEIIQPLDGDTSKVGDIIIAGTKFEEIVDISGSSSCSLISFNLTDTSAYGLPSTITCDEYITYLYGREDGNDELISIEVNTFTDSTIEIEYEYINRETFIQVMNRIDNES